MIAIFKHKPIQSLFATIMLVCGLSLLSINFYGLFVDIRKENLHQVNPELLRFDNDKYLSYSESLEKLETIQNYTGIEYALKANRLVQQSLTHVRWNKVDPKEFRQLVPIWENYFLYFIGVFFPQPQIERYHFVNYKRSLERGIGICGDASMILSQILDKKGIDNQIISYQGHVINSVSLNNDERLLLDPDFGVKIDVSLEQLHSNPEAAQSFYREAGYSEREINTLSRIYGTKHTIFDDVFEFMPKRYVFEYVSYVLKWLLPLFLIVGSGYFLMRIKKILTNR